MPKTLSLGEPADATAWRALVEKGLKGAPWSRLVGVTADGLAIEPLYREADIATASDPSGFPGAAPFIRGAGAGAWSVRQSFDHPSPETTNAEILADLAGGVGGVELVVDGEGVAGVSIRRSADLDVALSGVILEAAPISLDGADLGVAAMLESKLKGVAAPETAFNLDPIGALARGRAWSASDAKDATAFAARLRRALPEATSLRVDARAVHEAGGSEAQEIAAALASGIFYLRALTENDGFTLKDANATLNFAISVGPDVLIETAKLRALRLCWARVIEASGGSPQDRRACLHAFTSRRMMTRYDPHTNILRVAAAAFAAAVGGADAITTYPFTDALGLPTPFARRLARNTQNVLREECRLGQVADPAGGAWFVEKLTRDLAAKAWGLMQEIEAKGGVVASLQGQHLQTLVAAARDKRQKAQATRREPITGISDFPLLGGPAPETAGARAARAHSGALPAIRWAAPFEELRQRAEAAPTTPQVFFANLGPLAAFSARAQFARNLFAAGGIAPRGESEEYETRDAMAAALSESGAQVAVICGTDAAYLEAAENAAQRLKAGGARWVVIAGRPGEREAAFRAAGIDQFVFAGQDALEALNALHAALGVQP